MINLNYKHLRYFLEVAREGNLTRAARNLGVAQSALSTQIHTLEDRLSHHLFERVGRLFGPAMSGVICVRARKQAFPAIPRRKREERFVRVPGMSAATARQG